MRWLHSKLQDRRLSDGGLGGHHKWDFTLNRYLIVIGTSAHNNALNESRKFFSTKIVLYVIVIHWFSRIYGSI